MTNPFDVLLERLDRIEDKLGRLKVTVPERVGGIELAMEITDFSKPTIYRMASDRRIPHSKRGNKLFFRERDLVNWIAEGHKKTLNQIQTEV